MLIEKNLKDKRKSIYKCDHCGEFGTIKIYAEIKGKKKKTLDLCKRCYNEILEKKDRADLIKEVRDKERLLLECLSDLEKERKRNNEKKKMERH